MINYFAYGSNMSLARLVARLGAARKLGCYSLPQHELKFHKVGRDGSGKCDAFHTGDSQHFLYGVLFRISHRDKQLLDRFEGLGEGYDEKIVSVFSAGGDVRQAVLYYATHIDQAIGPFHWYKHHVLTGAREALLPGEYIARIEDVSAVVDTDIKRSREQMAIYTD